MWHAHVPDPSFARVTSATVRVMSGDGPVPGRPVVLEQVDHDFWFGNIAFDLIDHAAGNDDSPATLGLAEAYLDLFNGATLPFYLGRFEPRRGRPDTARLLAGARWCVDHGLRVKGHPLVWHTVTPAWLDALPTGEVEDALRTRIESDVADFAGLIDCWDAVNELVIMPRFTAQANGVTRLAQDVGRLAIARLAFETAHAVNPRATLLLNDFDLGPEYERLIEELLDDGLPVDVLGLQTHMHQGFRGEGHLADLCERFARFGLPLHFTETSLVSGDLMPPHIVDLNDYQVRDWPTTPEGEARQADEIVRHYRTLVAHPAVTSITYWGLGDAHAWLHAPSGLLRTDGTRKPAYDALHDLIKRQWWLAPTSGCTDADGCFRLTGFPGTYAVTVGEMRHLVHLGQATTLTLQL